MTAFLTILVVIVRIFSNSMVNVFQKKLVSQDSNAFLINALVCLLLCMVFLPWALLISWNTFPLELWGWVVPMGVCGACGNSFMIKALESGELSVLGSINSWKPVVGMLGGILLLSEFPSLCSGVGVLLIVGGSALVLGADRGGFHWSILVRKDIRFRILALVFTAVEAVLIKRVILLSTVGVAFLLWCWMGAIFSGVATMLFGKKLGLSTAGVASGRSAFSLLMLAICFGVMQYSTNLAFQLMSVGTALALFQLSALVNLWFGHCLFQETGMCRKVFGAILATAGAVLIILFP